MKLLVWESKYGDVLVSARDAEEEKRAWLYLFKCMDDNGFYCELDKKAAAYKDAKEGNAIAAQWLLEMRNSCEYEQVNIKYSVEP